MTNSVVVCRADELGPGERRLVTTPRGEVGVFNVGGTYRAYKNVCPHAGAPVCQGGISGTTTVSEDGEARWIKDGEILRCPWHQWEFDLTTGKTITSPTRSVATFRVEVEDGDVVLYV